MSTTLAVAISFVTFFLILFHFRVHKKVANVLDSRAEHIKNELNEARQLREDAQSLLASFERKYAEVDKLASEIIENAKADSEAYIQQAKADLERSVKNRIDAAEVQIAMAEKRAINNIQKEAILLSINSVKDALEKHNNSDNLSTITDKSIEKISSRFH
jgi:F-type H+-transporting ATPase subunit b